MYNDCNISSIWCWDHSSQSSWIFMPYTDDCVSQRFSASSQETMHVDGYCLNRCLMGHMDLEFAPIIPLHLHPPWKASKIGTWAVHRNPNMFGNGQPWCIMKPPQLWRLSCFTLDCPFCLCVECKRARKSNEIWIKSGYCYFLAV